MSPWYALLAVPMLAMLAVPMYAGADPDLAGVPFFTGTSLPGSLAAPS